MNIKKEINIMNRLF